MARSGTSLGTVIRWDDDRGGGVIESPDLPGDCWVESSAVHPPEGAGLRAGQVVEVEWAEPGAGGCPFLAVRVTRRDHLQATPGG
ncbi:MAG: uncharacterized protein JWO98_2764 [Frankiales bacterium]|nr:uncharacterized protein [Frankiales bacterium]